MPSVVREDGRVDWVADFYAKQYEWADWRRRWGEFNPDSRDPRVDAVTRHAGSGSLRILELGSGTGTTAASLAVAGHDVVAIELQAELAAHTQELAAAVTGGSLRAIAGDFYETEPPGTFDVVAYFDGFGIGNDEDQRRLLRRIAGWLTPVGALSWTCSSHGIGSVEAGPRRSSRWGAASGIWMASMRKGAG